MISAKIVADSVSAVNGQRITTYELEYPRFIHAELMTHRLFSRNAASSRAIPISKMMEMVDNTPAMPVEWGLNQAGMQAGELHPDKDLCIATWKLAARSAVQSAQALRELGLHKQIVNRVLEPFQIMKTIVTATEYDNFFWLRCHADAQPEIHVLADIMYAEYKNSTPQRLDVGEWHLPYIDVIVDNDTGYYSGDKCVTLEQAQKISASCCAQVSYRKLDESLDKAIKIYDQLVTMTPVHASPFEHLATPNPYPTMDHWEVRYDNIYPNDLEKGEHMDSEGNFWSGNFKGWFQYRQMISGNTCWDYEGE